MNKIIIITVLAVVLVGGAIFYIVNLDPIVQPTPVTPIAGNNPVTPPAPTVYTPSAPIVTTDASIIPTASTALVGGKVYPNGAITSYWFEYGLTAEGTTKTAAQNLGSGYINIPTPAYITGLKSNTKYYFRLVAQNSFGEVMGTQYAFQTTLANSSAQGGAPAVKSISATAIERTTATLSGSVDPNNAASAHWFEYGDSSNLGETTAFQPISGSAKSTVSVSIANLVAGTKYYFRLNAQNQFGTTNGTVMSFTTRAAAN